MPRKITHGEKVKEGRRLRAYYERNPVLFIITHYEGDNGVPEAGIPPLNDWYTWTLHRKVKGEPGEAICKSVESYPTEKQCRSAINTAKKAMAGVRFAQTQVRDA